MKPLKQEDLLQIMMHAYQKGQEMNEWTAKEMLEEIIMEIQKVYIG